MKIAFVIFNLLIILLIKEILFYLMNNVPMHEYKALKEWTESFYPEYEVLGEVNNYYQLAIKVTREN